MNDSTEDRLFDLFHAVDRQIDAGPLPSFAPPSRRWQHLAMAASIVAIVAGAWMTLAAGADAPTANVSARPTIEADDSVFVAAAEETCRELERARNGVAPRFRTTEAYLVVVQARRSTIDDAVTRLQGLPPPSDDVSLSVRVVDELRSIGAQLSEIERAAVEGRFDDAEALWSGVDPAIDRAVDELATRGATACR